MIAALLSLHLSPVTVGRVQSGVASNALAKSAPRSTTERRRSTALIVAVVQHSQSEAFLFSFRSSCWRAPGYQVFLVLHGALEPNTVSKRRLKGLDFLFHRTFLSSPYARQDHCHINKDGSTARLKAGSPPTLAAVRVRRQRAVAFPKHALCTETR